MTQADRLKQIISNNAKAAGMEVTRSRLSAEISELDEESARIYSQYFKNLYGLKPTGYTDNDFLRRIYKDVTGKAIT